VRESEGERASGETPSREPFVGRANATFRVRDSKTDFCVSNASLPLLINCSAMERREEVVEVEDLSSKDAFPLSGRNSGGGISRGSDKVFATGDILGVDIEFLEGTLTAERKGPVG